MLNRLIAITWSNLKVNSINKKLYCFEKNYSYSRIHVSFYDSIMLPQDRQSL